MLELSNKVKIKKLSSVFGINCKFIFIEEIFNENSNFACLSIKIDILMYKNLKLSNGID